MAGVKGLLQSKTFWGVVVVVLMPLLRRIGIDVDEATGSALAADLVTLAGAVLAIYGRIAASRKIDTSSPAAALVGGAKKKK